MQRGPWDWTGAGSGEAEHEQTPCLPVDLSGVADIRTARGSLAEKFVTFHSCSLKYTYTSCVRGGHTGNDQARVASVLFLRGLYQFTGPTKGKAVGLVKCETNAWINTKQSDLENCQQV